MCVCVCVCVCMRRAGRTSVQVAEARRTETKASSLASIAALSPGPTHGGGRSSEHHPSPPPPPPPPPAGLPRWSRRLVAIARLMHAHQIGTVFAKLSGSFRPRRVASTSSAPVVVCCIHQQRAYVSVCQYIIGTYIQRYMQTCKHTSACTSAALPSTDSSIVTLTQQLLAAVARHHHYVAHH